MKDMRAFILAAGYGERLRPITDHVPKPLLPILGRPLIGFVLERLVRLPIESIGINLHYKPEMLVEWLDASLYADKVKRFHETEILGTGGGLKNAAGFLSNSLFIVHNSDIVTDIDLSLLIENHLSLGSIATLAVHRNEKFNNVWIDRTGDLVSVRGLQAEDSGLCKVAFTGIAVYSPDFLQFLPEGNSSVVNAWLKVLRAGRKISTVDYSGCSWRDIGTPEAYSSFVFESLELSGEILYVHPSVGCSSAYMEGLAAIENDSVLGNGTYLRNCIVLPNTHIPDGRRLEDAIVGPDYLIKLEKKEGPDSTYFSEEIVKGFLQGSPEDVECRLVGTGGSDRKHFRLVSQGKSAVLMVCLNDDPDFQRHIVYTDFFRRHSLPVPAMFEADMELKQALFEDLGDFSLYSWLKCRRSPERLENIYRKVLDILVQLHTDVSRHIDDCPLLASRVFDYDHFRWETAYFFERFVLGLIGIEISSERSIKDEFHLLARTACSFPRAIVHRDFQSQNIMVTRGETPRVIDYQGARTGPPAYDVASILWDPYFCLEDGLRERLLNYYIAKTRSSSVSGNFNDEEFRYSLMICRLQRHMQALGAYGYLSKVKGKKYFLKHIPRAMEYLLKETAAVSDDLPWLHSLATELDAACQKKIADEQAAG